MGPQMPYRPLPNNPSTTGASGPSYRQPDGVPIGVSNPLWSGWNDQRRPIQPGIPLTGNIPQYLF
jgi:hypothetical protein